MYIFLRRTNNFLFFIFYLIHLFVYFWLWIRLIYLLFYRSRASFLTPCCFSSSIFPGLFWFTFTFLRCPLSFFLLRLLPIFLLGIPLIFQPIFLIIILFIRIISNFYFLLSLLLFRFLLLRSCLSSFSLYILHPLFPHFLKLLPHLLSL